MKQLLDGIDNETLLDLQRKIIDSTISNSEFLVLNKAIKSIIFWCAQKTRRREKSKTLEEIMDDKTIGAWQLIKKWDPAKGKLSSYLLASLSFPHYMSKRTQFNENAQSLDIPFDRNKYDYDDNDGYGLYNVTADKEQNTEQSALLAAEADKMLSLAEKVLTDHQKCILLRSINGWTDTAIAEKLGISAAGVCIQRHNALDKIRAVHYAPEIMPEVIRRTFSRYIYRSNKQAVAGQDELFDSVLTPRQKAILLRHLDGVSEVKIAGELDASAVVVHNSLKKSLHKLSVLRAQPEKLAHISKRTFMHDTNMREILQKAFADGTAKIVLSCEQLQICSMYLTGKTQKEVGAELGMSKDMVGFNLRKSVHLTEHARAYPDRIEMLKGFSKSKAAERDAIEDMLGRPAGLSDRQLHILQLRRNGFSTAEIGESMGVGCAAINAQIRAAKGRSAE